MTRYLTPVAGTTGAVVAFSLLSLQPLRPWYEDDSLTTRLFLFPRAGCLPFVTTIS